MIGIIVPFVVTFVVIIVVLQLALSAFGTDFLAALGNTEATKYGFESVPYFVELLGAWTGPAVGIVLAIGFGAWLWQYVPALTILVTRSMLAWSFDGIMPEWLGRVDDRGNPVNATLVTTRDRGRAARALLVHLVLLGHHCAARLHDHVPHRLLRGDRVPVQTPRSVRGLARRRACAGRPAAHASPASPACIGLGVMTYVLLADPASGTSWAHNRSEAIAMLVAPFVAAIRLRHLLVDHAASQGVNLATVMKELPVE